MPGAILTSLKTDLAVNIGQIAPWVKPALWPEIRNIPLGAVSMLATDAYPNVGFCISCKGGYTVKVDGMAHGVYQSGEACLLNLSSFEAKHAVEGNNAYVIEILPQSGAVKEFRFARVDAQAGRENNGVLWCHFELKTPVNMFKAFSAWGEYFLPLLTAVTALNDTLYPLSMQACYGEYLTAVKSPVLDMSKASGYAFEEAVSSRNSFFKIKNINSLVVSMNGVFSKNINLKEVFFKNCDFSSVITYKNTHLHNSSLKKLPKYDYSKAQSMSNFVTNASSLEDTYLDLSRAVFIKEFGFYGTLSAPVRGLKSLIVSEAAPFNGAAPQININYSGLEKASLLALFKSLPVVSGGQIISIVGATGAGELGPEDVKVAVDKGWTVAL